MTKLLLVDDDPFTLAMTGAILEDEGFEVASAESGADALAQLAAEPEVRVVISDLHMPGMDGLEFYDQLRHQGWRQPFILLTGEENPALDGQREIAAVIVKNDELPAKLPQFVKELLLLS